MNAKPDPLPSEHVFGSWLVLVAAASSTVTCLVLTAYLVMAPVFTSGLAEPGWASQECGRPALILNDGTAYQGGEYRPNQAEFDDACLNLSRERARVAATTGVAGILSLLPLGFVTQQLSRRSRLIRLAAKS